MDDEKICIAKEEECFDWFDKDGNGYINGMELPCAVRAVGQYWTFSELEQLNLEYPSDKPVSFNDFLRICSRNYKIVPNYAEIEAAFDVFDRYESGLIFLNELKHILTSVGEKITPEEFDELCQLHGHDLSNENVSINKEQFLNL